MPQLPEELFLASLARAARGRRRLGAARAARTSLYLRPFMIATEVGLGVRPSASYMFCVIASPGRRRTSRAGSSRSASGGPPSTCAPRPAAPAPPSSAATTPPRCAAQAQAAEKGCDQVVWLDAVERRWVEEMGGMNLFFVFGSGDRREVVTPGADRPLLPGRHPRLAADAGPELGYTVDRAADLTGRVGEGAADGRAHRGLRLRHRRGDHPGRPGPARRRRVRDQRRPARPGQPAAARELTDIQRGTAPDTHGWMRTLVPA